MSHRPIEPRFSQLMNDLAPEIDRLFNSDPRPGHRKVGFFLGVFPLGAEEGRFNYISNADRRDIVILLKEMLAKFEGQADVEGHG